MESCDVEGCEAQAKRISRLSPEGFLVGTGNKAYSFREAYKRFRYCEIHHEELMKSIWIRVSDEGDKSDDHVAPTAI
ncbi:MAG: hypothetical protein EB156_00315 [Euryarchaeota archaeon]|jgi:hypothetical protein|nr:hypothetical protein [Euryarchaeota archaeon]NDB93056.1 hypothetical protein [Euryarchaeota archaeon]NDF22225.1 hypothetical protein [Euryarchaeota archaeon]NDF36220.1 hypothetical protein [Euryarchaeota archaeon]NDG21083.1 hypothetical protein [Euryarchaeota archaeon]